MQATGRLRHCGKLAVAAMLPQLRDCNKMRYHTEKDKVLHPDASLDTKLLFRRYSDWGVNFRVFSD